MLTNNRIHKCGTVIQLNTVQNEKELAIVTSNNTDETHSYNVKQQKPDKKENTHMTPFTWNSKTGKPINDDGSENCS